MQTFGNLNSFHAKIVLGLCSCTLEVISCTMHVHLERTWNLGVAMGGYLSCSILIYFSCSILIYFYNY
ncbi:hypothetical protein Ahy_B05g075272 isoform C [Arachis hypogaea]|uniref:Uncharacterized protein n=1 Tax=Arachis hypogaea TaxID=3818 RepID=A0A444Z0X6_ARAHY|nr:hypothetical protein Ahy_B05g075272 isoform C [Arachis hypogaea]